MMVTERGLMILQHLRRYKFLVTQQIRALCFPKDKDGSVTRDRMRKLEGAGLVLRRRAEVANPFSSNTMPVWLPTEQGCVALSLRRDDTSYLLDASPSTRTWQNFAHYAAVSDVHIRLDRAIANQDRVRMTALYFEHDVINADASEPSKRYRLNTVVQEQPKKIVCAPDSAFELGVGKYRRAYYVELERGSDSPSRAVSKKHKGYLHLRESGKFKDHFPESREMRVIWFAPNASWRDSLRKEAGRKPGADMHLFISTEEATVELFLHGEIVHTCTEGPKPLVLPATGSGPVGPKGEAGGADV